MFFWQLNLFYSVLIMVEPMSCFVHNAEGTSADFFQLFEICFVARH